MILIWADINHIRVTYLSLFRLFFFFRMTQIKIIFYTTISFSPHSEAQKISWHRLYWAYLYKENTLCTLYWLPASLAERPQYDINKNILIRGHNISRPVSALECWHPPCVSGMSAILFSYFLQKIYDITESRYLPLQYCSPFFF